MIEVESLTRVYDRLTAVDGVSFTIRKGEVVGLLGRNGAGKSTVLKMMTGYLEPTSGSIHINGLNMKSDRRTVQKSIGYLPENCPVWPEMTIIDYLVYHASLRGIFSEQSNAAVARAIQRTKLHEKATDRIETLSRGYRQRVGVAQAILHDPDIVILDEPTNGLDPTQVHSMRALIKELSEHATVVISTHILQEVRAVCERVLIMRAGKLILDQYIDALKMKYHNTVRLIADRNVSELLNGIDGVQCLGCTDDADCRVIHNLKMKEEDVPVVARAIHEAGASLYALEPQRLDLEAIFSETNEESSHVA